MIGRGNIKLRTVNSDDDYHFLHDCYSDRESAPWNANRHVYSFREFIDYIYDQISKELVYFIITLKSGDQEKPIGFVYTYNTRKFDGVTYLCLFISRPYQGCGIGIKAGAHILNYLFKTYGFRKIYTEVLSCNLLSLNTIKKCGFLSEGCLQEYWYYNSKYWDMCIFSIPENKVKELEKKYSRFLL